MLDEHERRLLARIEAQLADSDPGLARRLAAMEKNTHWPAIMLTLGVFGLFCSVLLDIVILAGASIVR